MYHQYSRHNKKFLHFHISRLSSVSLAFLQTTPTHRKDAADSHQGPVTGKVADVIAAANLAAEVALRLVRPGRKHKDVTEAIQKVAVVLGPPPNVTVSRLGSPSSTFAYTIPPSHEPSSVPNSTDSNNSLPNLNGYHDFAEGVTSTGFSLTHSKANLQLIRLRKLSFLYTTKTGPEIFNSLHDCSGNWRVLFCWLPYDVLFNDSSEWFCPYPVGKLEKGLLIAADLFDEKSKRWREVYRGTLFDFIYHPLVWDPGDALTKTTELMLCFKCQENHFNEHPQFLDLQLHSIDYVVHFTCLQPHMFATRVGIIQHKSWLLYSTAVQSQCMRYCFCTNLSTDYVVCMTEMQGFFHASGLYIYDHEPYHTSIVGVCPFAAIYVILPIQRLVSLALIIDPLVILTAFDKHFNGEESVAWCNATYPVDVIAFLFVSHNTPSHLVESFKANGLLPLHDLIEMAYTDFGLKASAMISFVYLEGLLGHDQGSIGLQVWGNNGSHGLVGKIQILGTASTIEELELIFMEPIKQAHTSKNFRDAPVRCFLLCKTITHDDLHIFFVLSHNEEVMPLIPTCLLRPNMDFMSMILWCGMKSLVIHDVQKFFTVNSHLDHAKMLKVLIGIKLLYENWQEKSEATLGNARVTSRVFRLNAWRILTLPHEKTIVRTASCDWVMKFCIRDDFVGVPLSRHWKYAVLGSSSWGEEYANDCQKPLVVQSSCLGASSSLQSLFHHAHTTRSSFIPIVDKFQKLTIDFELSSSKMDAELLTNSAIVYQGSTETEWMRKCYLFHFFTSAFQHSKSVIWFFTDDILFTAWIRHVCSVVDQMTNPFDGVPKCFNYWKGLVDFVFFLHHPMATYGMLGADSLLYFTNYQGIQSSMESLNWWDISSTFSGVLRNNNWPSLTKLGVFFFTKLWVCKLWEHLFMSTNSILIIRSATSWIDHPMGVTEPKNLNTNSRSWLLLTTSTETWVPAAQNAENYLDNTCHSFGELVVGDAPTPIVILFNAVKISVLPLFSSISAYLANLHDFILAGYQLLIFVFCVNTLKKFWKDMVRDLKTIQKLILHMSLVLHWTKWLASFPV